jgi:competence protein ComEC
MNFRSFSLIYFFATTVILASFIISWPDDKLHVIACDVGQGDSFLITYGFHQILIDGGKGKSVVSCLDTYMPFWDRQLDMLVATHDDDDHVGGLGFVADRFGIKMLVYNGKDSESDQWQALVSKLEKRRTDLVGARGQSYLLKDLNMQFIWPVRKPQETDEDNQSSVVMRLAKGSFSVLFTGDIDTLTEEKLMKSPQTLASTVLKVGHHGSKYSTSDEWLNSVAPRMALIGVGKNSHGHPNPEVLDRLQDKGITTYRTDKDGSVELVSDGKNWWVGR